MSNSLVQADLDSRLIFDNYSYYIPMTIGDNDTTESVYRKLYNTGDFFYNMGVTDILFPPPFKTSSTDVYNDGYNIADRYDVGEFNQFGMIRTKYGTKDELKKCIRYLKMENVNAICNVNCNSVLFDQKQVVEASACDKYGNTTNIKDANYLNFLYYCDAAGGGLGQVKYGTFQEWDKTKFNGTQAQGYGIYRVMVDTKLVPYYYVEGNTNTSTTNNTSSTTTVKPTPANNIPSWINIDNGDVPQTVNGYFVIDGYYTKKDGTTVLYADVYSDPRNNVISQTWASYKIQNGATSDVNAWISEQPGYNEETDALFPYYVFVVPGTQIVDSTTKKTYIQYPYDQDCISGEFYKGLDVNNTNTVVQTETLNWIGWILNLGFNGLMFEAADYYNYNLLTSISNYVSTLSSDTDYLQLVKTDDSSDMIEFQYLVNNNSQSVYDSDQYNSFLPISSPLKTSTPLTTLFIGSCAWNQRTGTSTASCPNWSYVNNAETESNLLSEITTPTKLKNSDEFTINKAKLQLLEQDRHITNKLYAPYNEVICYAIILTNSYTTPSVFYGDLWRSDANYMTTKTCYYQYITHLMKLRTRFAYGGQNVIFHTSNTSSTKAGYDLVSSTRFGINSETGLIVVISNNPNIDTVISVYTGKYHAGQTYMNMFSYQRETAVVTSSGYISLQIVGNMSYAVYGHLSVWVPVTDPSVYDII